MGEEVVFKKGDRIRHKVSGDVGIVVGYFSSNYCWVKWNKWENGAIVSSIKSLIKIEDEIDYDNLNEIEE